MCQTRTQMPLLNLLFVTHDRSHCDSEFSLHWCVNSYTFLKNVDSNNIATIRIIVKIRISSIFNCNCHPFFFSQHFNWQGNLFLLKKSI